MEGQDRNKNILLRVPWETGLKTSDPDRLMRCIYFSSYLGTTEVKLLRLQYPDGNCLEWTQGSCWLFAVGLDPDSSAQQPQVCLCQKSRTGQQHGIEVPVFMTSAIVMIWEVVRVADVTQRSVRCANSCFDIVVTYMCFDKSWVYA